ncbi:MAG: hypothetical protein OHK0022_60510 [Roseiflexaceae bacterium]
MTTRDQAPARLSDIALTVLKKRYLIKDDLGNVIETPETMFRRIADTIAAIDTRYGATPEQVKARSDSFYQLMAEGWFEPNSPTLMNAGRPLGQLSACFVLPVEDDLSSIYETLKHQALVHQSGGGTGFSFSQLRPRNDVVRSTMGVASGPVSFMDVYNHSTEAIKQGGTRRGANMGILRVDHPDILEFITVKQDLTKITNFNISVAITDTFMEALRADTTYDLINPRTGEVHIAQREDLKHPVSGAVLVKKGEPCRLHAREVFDLIVQCAHATGEPGLFFIDRANQYNPVPQLGSYEATNPCGEQPLLAYDVCNLGSINLGLFVTEDQNIDWDRLREVVHQSTRFLDNVIDANNYPLPQIRELSNRIRRIGLGVMGWADMLIRLDVPYNSDEAIELGRRVMGFVDEESKRASEQLAAERGTFPEWERSIWGPDATCARDAQGQRIRPERKLRNCNVTTVAPTGTISMIAGCSSGIEPIFAVAFWRYQADTRMLDINPDFVARAQREGWHSEELMARIADTGHIHHAEVPEAVQRAFVTAHDIAPAWHVRMQGAFQEYTDSAISKCIAAGTLIPTSRGLVRVEDFAETVEDDTFTALDGETRTAQGYRITQHYHAGHKPAVKITLDNGASLTGAVGSHRVLTSNGWQLMSDLKLGDVVLGRLVESHGAGGAAIEWTTTHRTSANHTIQVPERMSPDFALFLGMLAADGHTVETTGNVGISCKDEEVERVFGEIVMRLFGCAPKMIEDSRTGVRTLYLTSRNLARCIENLIGKGAYNKHVPEQILKGNAEEKLAFLSGLTLDGYLVQKTGVLYVYNGMSERLAYEAAELCRSFGLPKVNQGRKQVPGYGLAHYVAVSNELQARIRCVESRKNAAQPAEIDYLVFIGDRAQTTISESHPAYFAVKALRQRGHTWCMRSTAERLDWPTDTLAYQVTTIEDAGLVDLYDIEVEQSHEYVVNGIISHNTINFSYEATTDDVREAYELAFSLGCKGITVYRDGSRSNQVLSTGSTGKAAEQPAEQPAAAPAHEDRAIHPRKVPVEGLPSHSFPVVTPLGKMRLFVTELNGQPFEVFAIIGRAGSDVTAFTEAIGRLLSLALRCGIPVNLLAEQLRGIGGSRSAGFGPNQVRSVPDAMGKLLQEHYVYGNSPISSNGNGHSNGNGYSNGNGHDAALLGPALYLAAQDAQHSEVVSTGEICPECQNATLMNEEGCRKCHTCGYAEC